MWNPRSLDVKAVLSDMLDRNYIYIHIHTDTLTYIPALAIFLRNPTYKTKNRHKAAFHGGSMEGCRGFRDEMRV